MSFVREKFYLPHSQPTLEQAVSLRSHTHRKALPGKSGVPMMLCGCNDLGLRLQKLTASFGLLRSELTNSQMGVVKFCCVHLETMEIQLEQLVLFESDEMLDWEFTMST